MLIVSSDAPASGAYVSQLVGGFSERLDVERFTRSWTKLAYRYEILRTHFDFDPGLGWVQYIAKDPSIRIQVEDWRQYTATQRSLGFDNFLQRDRKSGFSLRREIPYRIRLFRYKDDFYQMVWTFHHVLLDGRSHTLIVKDLLATYDATSSPIFVDKESSIRYPDYLYWLQKHDISASEEYWKQYLLGAEKINMDLKGQTRRRIFASDSKLVTTKIELPERLTADLYKIADQYDLTANTLSVAAWALVVNCYTEGEEALLGVVRSCRHSLPEQLQSVCGLVINTVPLRVGVSGNQNILTWLRQVRANWVALRSHELSPVSDIRRWCAWPVGKPMFSSIHVYDHEDVNTLVCPDSRAQEKRSFRLIDGRTETALSVSTSGGSQFSAVIQADEELFTHAEIDQLGSRYAAILEQMIAHPERRLSCISHLTAWDRQQLNDFNKHASITERSESILDLFHQQVQSTPSHTAIAANDNRLSYRQLYEASSALADAIANLKQSGPVGILIGSEPDFVVALFATLITGAGFVPLDPEYPNQRLGFMLTDCGSRTIVTNQSGRDQAVHIMRNSGSAGKILALKNLHPFDSQSCETISINGVESHVPEQFLPIDGLVYIVYTSGTTGQPKGVPITSSNLMPLMQWQKKHFELGRHTRTVQTLSVSFDFGLQEIFTTLLFGGSFFCPPSSVLIDPERYVEFIECNSINMVYATPSFMEAILTIKPKLDSLRIVLLGGERLGWDLIDKLRQSVPPDCVIFNGYGPTEATMNCAMYKIRQTNEIINRISASVPIGRPTGLSSLYVLDDRIRQAPIGVPGELYIGGPGVAGGYFDRPNLTRQKFVPDSLTDQPGSYLYRTGDRVVLHSDNNLEFLGRFDNQIKVRGYRVELEEIETTLSQHPQVISTATKLREISNDHRQIVAFVVPNNNSLRAEEIVKFARERLPHFMVPARIWLIDSLPLTKTGKVDRDALQAPSGREIARIDGEIHREGLERNPLEEWFYSPIWRRLPQTKELESDCAESHQDCWLIFSDGSEFCRVLAANLEGLQMRNIQVLHSETYSAEGNYTYRLNSDQSADYKKLFEELAATGINPTKIISFWSLLDQSAGITESVDDRLKRLLYLLQAIGKNLRSHDLHLGIVTSSMQSVTGEESLNPRLALLLGMCKSIPYEHPNIRWASIDLDQHETSCPKVVEQLIADLNQKRSGEVIAYRGGLRYILDYQNIPLCQNDGSRLILNGGVCLITGGLGAIGLELAQAMMQNGYKVALLDTPAATATIEKTPSVKLQKLFDMGGEIFTIGANICDQGQVSLALDKIRKKLGKIDGVIHAAGIVQPEIINKLTVDAIERVLEPKVRGTEVLATEIVSDQPDFVLLCSSIDAIRGSFSQSAYCAANAFQDAFASHMRRSGQHYMSINWDVWREVGMAARVEVSPAMEEFWRHELSMGITSLEGRQILNNILCREESQIIVSTLGLKPRIGRFFLDLAEEKINFENDLGADNLDQSIEKKILAVFAEVLEDSSLAGDDDFFQNGGDSLSAMRVIARIRDTFDLNLPMSSVFEAPTANQLAGILRETMELP